MEEENRRTQFDVILWFVLFLCFALQLLRKVEVNYYCKRKLQRCVFKNIYIDKSSGATNRDLSKIAEAGVVQHYFLLNMLRET